MTSAPGVWTSGPAFTPGRADFGLAYDAAANKLYAMGGDTTGGGFFDSSNLVNELSVAAWPAGTWNASTPNLPVPNRQANQAGFYGAGQIWSVGGINGATFQFLAEVWRRTNGVCPGIAYSDATGGDTYTDADTGGDTDGNSLPPTPTPTATPPTPTPTPFPRLLRRRSRGRLQGLAQRLPALHRLDPRGYDSLFAGTREFSRLSAAAYGD